MTLKEVRLDRRLTQEELAELSGVDQTSISAIERGTVQSPSWDTVSRLAKALGAAPEELFPVSESRGVA